MPSFRSAILAAVTLPLCRAAAPCRDGACDDDVSSLLQLGRTRVGAAEKAVGLQSLPAAGDAGEPAPQAGGCPSVGASAFVTNAALQYLMSQAFPFTFDNIEDGKLPVDAISGAVAGFDYTFKNIALHAVGAGPAIFKFEVNRGIDVHLPQVMVQVTIDYHLSSNSWWTSLFEDARGTLTVHVAPSSFATFVAAFGLNPAGSPAVSLQDVDIELSISKLDFEGPGVFDTFLDIITALTKPILTDYVEQAIETEFRKAGADIGAILDDIVESDPFPFPLKNETEPNSYSVDVKACGFVVGTDYIALNAYAGVTAEGNVYSEPGYDLSTTGFTPVQSAMLGVAASEWTVNGLLWIFRRQSGLLSLQQLVQPVRLQTNPGSLEDGRAMQDVAQETVESAVKSVQGAEATGFEILKPSVRFFSQAVAGVADISLNLRVLLELFLGEDAAAHVAFGDEAQRGLEAGAAAEPAE